METENKPEVHWTHDFITLSAEMPAMLAYEELQDTTAYGVVIVRKNNAYYYAYDIEEILQELLDKEQSDAYLNGNSLTDVLVLQEVMQSTVSNKDSPLPSIDTSWRPNVDVPTVNRYVMIDDASDDPDKPLAIGEMLSMASQPELPTRGRTRLKDRIKVSRAAERPSHGRTSSSVVIPAASANPDFLGDDADKLDILDLKNEQDLTTDEGTRPLRYPSLELEGELLPKVSILFHIDLLREKSEQTHGDALNVGEQADDWNELTLTVVLSCPLLEFADDTNEVVIRRNKESIPAEINAMVSADAKANSLFQVVATFFSGTRYCGMAQRIFFANLPNFDNTTDNNKTKGVVVSEPIAKQPDLTVYITRIDQYKPSQLHWRVLTEKVPNLPAKLSAQINIGQAPEKQTTELFKKFSQLEYGKHQRPIEAFGSQLWQLAPEMFHKTYWALSDALQRQLTIQFITDDPHIPWEIMRPARKDESEFHPPLIIKHAVARWIERWEGYMRNQLSFGDIYTIAPEYKSHSRKLPRAQVESNELVKLYKAKKVEGTYQAVNNFLESNDNDIEVGILHFAGHGKFSSEVATASVIKLQDGELTASEIARPEVALGKRCQTLVFFNACEVGSSGSVLGEIGGWADAFLGRQFGGFIAPLWSVDDTDASIVADELIEAIYTKGKPIGAALQNLRHKHGATSPTFYSYLYYGDVTAHLTLQ